MNDVQRSIRIAGTAAVVLGLGALLYVGVVMTQAMTASSAPIAKLDRSVPLVAGQKLGQLRIERLGLDAAISEGDRASVLKRGVGHLHDTPWIGQGGNVALAGHRDTVFRSLRRIENGDVIEIDTADRTIHYRVEKTAVVSADDLSVLQPSGRSTLTLITCYPFTFFGSAPDRFIVRAREIHQ
jgi:sortase A